MRRSPTRVRNETQQTRPTSYAFPFIFPGMYSVPDPTRAAAGLGSVHYLFPNGNNSNHSPLDLGETPGFQPMGNQTFWGMPTWRETMAGLRPGNPPLPGWTDPINFLGKLGRSTTQPLGLRPIPPNVMPATYNLANLLPPVYKPGTYAVPPFFDGVGSSSFVAAPAAAGSTQPLLPNPIWEDDLILTNVRSFDVKAYDQSAPLYSTAANGLFSSGYWDLGYGGFVNGVAGESLSSSSRGR